MPEIRPSAFLACLLLVAASVIGIAEASAFEKGRRPRSLLYYAREDLPAVVRNLAFVYGPMARLWLPGWTLAAVAASPLPLESSVRPLLLALGGGWALVVVALAARWARRPPERLYPAWFAEHEADHLIRRPDPGWFDNLVALLGYAAGAIGVGFIAAAAIASWLLLRS